MGVNRLGRIRKGFCFYDLAHEITLVIVSIGCRRSIIYGGGYKDKRIIKRINRMAKTADLRPPARSQRQSPGRISGRQTI
jgi:hypothetical protein